MSGRIDIRREDPTSADAVDLIEELNATMLDLYPPEHCHHMPPETLADKGACFLVARDADGAVGCGAVVPLDGEIVELKRFYTRPHARRSGAAKGILKALEAWSIEQGFRHMMLETGSRSDPAIALYAGHGFTTRGPFGDYEPTADTVFYEKSIAGTAPATT